MADATVSPPDKKKCLTPDCVFCNPKAVNAAKIDPSSFANYNAAMTAKHVAKYHEPSSFAAPYYASHAPSAAPKPSLDILKGELPRSQKARGYRALLQHNCFTHLIVPQAKLIRQESDIAFLVGNEKTEDLFVRPCPVRPRHGFVDSRVVRGSEQISKVWAEAVAADPDAEMLLMAPVKASHNTVWVPESGVLSIGKGHDGATGGHMGFTFPVVPKTKGAGKYGGWANFANLRTQATIAEDQHAYFEVVYPHGTSVDYKGKYDQGIPYLVQARSGPALPTTTEYNPVDTTVTEVMVPDLTDLLGWETLCIKKANTPGVVGWLPEAPMGCHSMIHCMMNGLSFFNRKEKPVVGQFIERIGPVEDPVDMVEVHKGITLADAWPAEGMTEAANAALTFTHNAVTMRSSPHYSRLLGFSCAIAFKAGALACLGENRHFNAPAGWYGAAKKKKKKETAKPTRSQMYAKYHHFRLRQLAGFLGHINKNYMAAGAWGDNTKSNGSFSYGGPRWFVATNETIKMYNVMCSGDPAAMGMQLNVMIHLTHNGGAFLNKFIDMDFNRVASDPGEMAVLTAPIWWNVVQHDPTPYPKFKKYVQRAFKLVPEVTVEQAPGCYPLIHYKMNEVKWISVVWDKAGQAMMETFLKET